MEVVLKAENIKRSYGSGTGLVKALKQADVVFAGHGSVL